MRRIATAVALGLAACGAAGASGARQADAAATQGPTGCVPGPDETGWSQDMLDVNCFVRWVYAPGVLETLSPLGDDAPRIFTAEVLDLMDAARAATEESHPAFEADPLCQCQDPGGLRFLISAVPELSPRAALARVAFDFRATPEPVDPGEAVAVDLVLRKEAQGWRVDDVRTREGYSFRRSLAGD